MKEQSHANLSAPDVNAGPTKGFEGGPNLREQRGHIGSEELRIEQNLEHSGRSERQDATVRYLLEDRMPPDQADRLAVMLALGTWTHDHPITPDEAKAVGLRVSTDMPPDVYGFMDLFPQPMRTTPSVQYVPIPHRDRGAVRR